MNGFNFNFLGATTLSLVSAFASSGCGPDVQLGPCDSVMTLVGPTGNGGQSRFTLKGCAADITVYDHLDDAGTSSGGVSIDPGKIINPICSAKFSFVNKQKITAFSDRQDLCNLLIPEKLVLSVDTGAQVMLDASGTHPTFAGDPTIVFSYEAGEPTHKNLNLQIAEILEP